MQPSRDYTSRELFGRFWRGYLRPHLPTMVLAFLVMMLEGSTLGLLSYMLEPLFDQVFAPGNVAGARYLPAGMATLDRDP